MGSRTKKYDVFVSYRRDGGYETALPIVEKLRSAGYRVFFDLESLNSGKFNEQLLGVIAECKDFVLVLPENGLDRCSDESDWVRREVVCAIENHKNIVPVMLKGFTWVENLPEPLAELPNYQGVTASDRETFDLAVERLKSYLKSRPHVRWKKWLTLGGVAVVALVVLVAVGYFTFRQLAKPVCVSAGTQMTLAMDLIHNINVVDEDFNRAWEAYVAQRQKSSEKTKARLDSGFIANIHDYYIPAIEKIAGGYPDFSPMGSYDRFLLGLYDVDPADVDGLKTVVAIEGDNYIAGYMVRELAIKEGNFNVESLNNIRNGCEAMRNGLNSTYYRYLEFMSLLPKTAWNSHRVASAKWHLYPTVSENMDAEEYAQLADKEMKKMESRIVQYQAFVEMLSNHANRLEEYLSDRENALSELEGQVLEQSMKQDDVPSVNPEVEAAKKRVEKLHEEVVQQRVELSEADRRVAEQFDSFKKKFAIDGSEDQYLKWGKVCKAANYLELTLRFNKERTAENMAPAVTNEQALQYVVEQLDAYKRYHPETMPYVASAKAFYREVASGKRGLSGMVMMGTQNDERHPLLRVGDIVLSRNGKSVDSAKGFDTASKLSVPGTIRFLRLENGSLREVSADYPETKVNIGLMYLKD